MLAGQRLAFRYDAASTGTSTRRNVSPLRLIHYRDNWYLDAWCHRQNRLRTFSVDCIDGAALGQELGGSYGIFARLTRGSDATQSG